MIRRTFVIADPSRVLPSPIRRTFRHHPTRRTFVVNRVAARFSPPGRRIRAPLQFVLRRSKFGIELKGRH
jgi:hypothetical protein